MPFDVAIVGGGIVGCATALAINAHDPSIKIVLFEKEPKLASHQTGHNSGVIHAGLYYRPGSVKAITCCSGREALYQFCAEENIPHRRCGKIIVATEESELPALEELERRGKENGLDGLVRLNASELKNHEPHVSGIGGLYVPQTGIVNYTQVAHAMADILRSKGVVIKLATAVREIRQDRHTLKLRSDKGNFSAQALINCAGLHSDHVARLAGIKPPIRIIPFRGEYYELKKKSQRLVNHLIYPVPIPQMPFLGVHFTRMIDDKVEAGPNAVLALKREGYRRCDISLRDLADILAYKGFWKLSARYWRLGLVEYRRSFLKSSFVKSLQKLIPELQSDDLLTGGSGVRAQAVDKQGLLLDDFYIHTEERMIHVLNAPSPAATASLSIGKQISEKFVSLI